MPNWANGRIRPAGAIALVAMLACPWIAGAAEPDSFASAARPLLEKYCFQCHGPDVQEGKLDLAAWRDEASLEERQEQVLGAIEKLRGYAMPPPKEPQPVEAERAKLIGVLSAAMDRIDAARPPRAGRVPLRRLNRVEYQNTLRDLLGMELALTEDFPADDSAHGFDNVADGLSLSPLLLEKYLAAAERALEQVVVVADPSAQVLERRLAGEELRDARRGRKRAGNQSGGSDAGQVCAALDLALEHEVGAEADCPADG
jgi:mono/diheme cytochrome c family protein